MLVSHSRSGANDSRTVAPGSHYIKWIKLARPFVTNRFYVGMPCPTTIIFSQFSVWQLLAQSGFLKKSHISFIESLFTAHKMEKTYLSPCPFVCVSLCWLILDKVCLPIGWLGCIELKFEGLSWDRWRLWGHFYSDGISNWCHTRSRINQHSLVQF